MPMCWVASVRHARQAHASSIIFAMVSMIFGWKSKGCLVGSAEAPITPEIMEGYGAIGALIR